MRPCPKFPCFRGWFAWTGLASLPVQITRMCSNHSMRQKIFLILISLLLVQAVAYSQPARPQYRIGLVRASSMFSHNEQFSFSLNGTQTMTIEPENGVFYFPEKLDSGQQYRISQLAGPRAVNFITPPSGIISGELQLTVDLGHPPLSIFRITLTGIEPGESFSFADNYGRSLSASFNSNINLGGFPQGDSYRIIQTGGPRQCVMTWNTGIVPDSGIMVFADCRKQAPVIFPPGDSADLITRNTDNSKQYTYYESWTPVIGGRGKEEGRYVAFTMYGGGTDGSTGKYRQVFWRDRKLGITKLVSKNAQGIEGNGNSFVPAISADGQTVAFESYASNLCMTDNNGTRDVFVWNAASDAVSLVSKATTGGTGNGESYEPVISGDGNVIAYTSSASDIVTLEPVFNTPNVYVYTQQSGSAIFITKDIKTGKAAGGYAPSISEDGRRIAFCSISSKLVDQDENNLWDIFLWKSGAPALQRISVPAGGGERTQGEESASRVVWPAISGNGEYIVYSTTADNLVPDDRNRLQDIFMYTVATGQVKRISVGEGGLEGNGDSPVSQGDRIGISYDGSWITYNTAADNLGVPKGNIILQNTITGQRIPITRSAYGSTGRPSISGSGLYVAAGCSGKYDPHFDSSGLFIFYTGDPALLKEKSGSNQ